MTTISERKATKAAYPHELASETATEREIDLLYSTINALQSSSNSIAFSAKLHSLPAAVIGDCWNQTIHEIKAEGFPELSVLLYLLRRGERGEPKNHFHGLLYHHCPMGKKALGAGGIRQRTFKRIKKRWRDNGAEVNLQSIRSSKGGVTGWVGYMTSNKNLLQPSQQWSRIAFRTPTTTLPPYHYRK